MQAVDERDFHLDAQQGRALDLVLKGKNVFVTGKVGTGKSALVRAIERVCPGLAGCDAQPTWRKAGRCLASAAPQ